MVSLVRPPSPPSSKSDKFQGLMMFIAATMFQNAAASSRPSATVLLGPHASPSDSHWHDFVYNSHIDRILSNIKFVIHLQAKPELRGHAEVSCKSQSSICRNATFFKNDFIYGRAGT